MKFFEYTHEQPCRFLASVNIHDGHYDWCGNAARFSTLIPQWLKIWKSSDIILVQNNHFSIRVNLFYLYIQPVAYSTLKLSLLLNFETHCGNTAKRLGSLHTTYLTHPQKLHMHSVACRTESLPYICQLCICKNPLSLPTRQFLNSLVYLPSLS